MDDRTQELIELAQSYDKTKYLKLLPKACKFAKKAHQGQIRESGEPYYTHPIEVAISLAKMKLDAITLITAVLHDTVEDTKASLEDLKKGFGAEIAELVNGVTKLSKIQHQSESERQAENFRKLLIAMSRDIRVLIVKLADRLHNMQTLSYVNSPKKRHEKALETMEIYAPLAERIGMQQIKNELQDLAFAQLYPEVRDSIISRLNLLRLDGSPLITKIISDLKNLFNQHHLKVEIIGREKTPFSIWHKMKQKNISFEQLSDVMAFRIIVEDIQDCYQTLGIIHQKYHVVPGTFKDYISTPKKNGYQSLHTIIIGPEDHRIEIQIRSQEMHQIAELGLAAHWSYKQSTAINEETLKYNWIKELLLILESTSDSEEFLENTKLEMYYDQVFCFTPKGRVIALPRGATAIDFAYGVHSDIGNKCVGAKINGRIAPLRTVLENGDQVEIVTNDDHKPLPSWEKFAITGKALSEIKKVERQEKRQEYINLGRLIMAQITEKNDLDINDEIIKSFAERHGKKTNEDFLCSLGDGTISYDNILKSTTNSENKKTSFFSNKFQFLKFKKEDDKTDKNKISIKGLIPGMAVHFASCCHPIPGDTLVGIVQTGKGITVHVSDCETLQNYSNTPEKWLDLSWDKDDQNKVYTGTIDVIVLHQPGSLATVTNEIAKQGANISNIKVVNRSIDFFEVVFDLEVKGVNHLTNIIASLRSQPCIHSVTRSLKFK
jgi:GTP pyrophosphokinase